MENLRNSAGKIVSPLRISQSSLIFAKIVPENLTISFDILPR